MPLTLTVFAETSDDGYLTYTVTDGEATITDCDSSISGDYEIPDTLGGYPVTAIGEYAFYDCSALESVTSFGSSVFYGISFSAVIYGAAGSYAETYANNNGINFVVCAHDTIETVNYADAACTEDGYTEDEICTVRGESLAEDEEETSLWDSIRRSMCDAYEAFADIPVIGTLTQIIHLFVHLARYIAYIT